MKVVSQVGLAFRKLVLGVGENDVDEAVWQAALDGSPRLRQLVEQGQVLLVVEGAEPEKKPRKRRESH